MEEMTYGERQLAKAEFRLARRRRAVLLLPGAAVIFWALADLVAARHGRVWALTQGDGALSALLRHTADHLQPVAWTLALVLVPLLVALKPKPKRTGAIIALFAGPVLTPLLFGAGGWRLWQITALSGIVLWIESQDQLRARRAAAVETSEESGEPASLHSISPASFQRRSSS